MSELNLLQKLNEFRKTVGKVRKDASNPFYKSKYATLESVINTIEEPLNKIGIGYIQVMVKREGSDCLATLVYDVDNTTDKLESSVPLLLEKLDMQKLGSAITYARRYGLVSIFGLEQEDDDGNGAVRKPNNQAPNNVRNPNISTSDNKKCDKCGSLMKLRKSARGEFYGCSNYPNCKNIVNIEKTEQEILDEQELEDMRYGDYEHEDKN